MPSPESDIDVMIEVENYTPEVEALIDELVFEINLNHDCLISAVIFGSKELHEGPLRESLSRRDPVSYFHCCPVNFYTMRLSSWYNG